MFLNNSDFVSFNPGMTFQDFIYWIQGYFELGGNVELSRQQVGIIKNHLDLVAKTKATMRQNELTFCRESFQQITDWIKKLDIGQVIPHKEVESWKDRISQQFNHLNPSSNPFIAPSKEGYESLGDVYDSQRLC